MLDIFSKKGIIFLVQIDHIKGEIIGAVFDYFYSAGALNVQCINTITKKNRPGYIFIVDVLEEKADAIEHIIISELGSTGWHRIETDHRHVPVEIISKDIEVANESSRFEFQVKGKQRKDILESVRPEHSSCIELKEKIKNSFGIDISIRQIYIKLQAILLDEDQTIISF